MARERSTDHSSNLLFKKIKKELVETSVNWEAKHAGWNQVLLVCVCYKFKQDKCQVSKYGCEAWTKQRIRELWPALPSSICFSRKIENLSDWIANFETSFCSCLFFFHIQWFFFHFDQLQFVMLLWGFNSPANMTAFWKYVSFRWMLGNALTLVE